MELSAKSLIEQKEANMRRAQKVVDTIAEKQRRAETETRKLLFIRQELQKLDKTLSTNIDILRTEIEKVGRECAGAQREFDVKEREYLECRKALAKHKQRKMLLQGHLVSDCVVPDVSLIRRTSSF